MFPILAVRELSAMEPFPSTYAIGDRMDKGDRLFVRLRPGRDNIWGDKRKGGLE